MGKNGRKAYELTAEEVRLVQGYRQGRIALPAGRWMAVSKKEAKAIGLWRRQQFGELHLVINRGEPVEFRVTVRGRFDKELVETAIALIEQKT